GAGPRELDVDVSAAGQGAGLARLTGDGRAHVHVADREAYLVGHLPPPDLGLAARRGDPSAVEVETRFLEAKDAVLQDRRRHDVREVALGEARPREVEVGSRPDLAQL